MIFEFNDAQILFGMFQGFKKVTPLGGAKKLRLTLPPVRRVFTSLRSTFFRPDPIGNTSHNVTKTNREAFNFFSIAFPRVFLGL